jgi:uncharacterized protein (TIGR01777 family)
MAGEETKRNGYCRKFHMEGPCRIALTGSSGLIGSSLAVYLESGGHRVVRLVRSRPGKKPTDIYWDPVAGEIDASALEGCHAVVHLAGESIASGRWTEARKRAILESRTKGTRLIAETLAAREVRPGVLISASAAGFYGDRGDEELTEESGGGEGFLADVCQAWERAAEPAREAGIRLVHLRSGMVLSPHGGAVEKMLLPFRLGLGGKIGSGRQWVSWIGLEDTIEAICFLLQNESISGPVNVVSPEPVTNADFTQSLARVLRRPAVLPIPVWAISLLFGEMGRSTLLSSTRLLPKKLEESGFLFARPSLEQALRHELGEPER